jgi:hypothetical protein
VQQVITPVMGCSERMINLNPRSLKGVLVIDLLVGILASPLGINHTLKVETIIIDVSGCLSLELS